MRLLIIVTGLLIGIMLGPIFGAEPPPPTGQATTEVLELRKALFESQMQNLATAIQAIDAELQRRKTMAQPQKQPEKK